MSDIDFLTVATFSLIFFEFLLTFTLNSCASSSKGKNWVLIMHFVWCPQGTWKQQNNSTAGKVIFWTDKSGDLVSFFIQVVKVVEIVDFCCLENFYICQ